MNPSVCYPSSCCCSPWELPQGEAKPLRMDFSPWLKETGWPALSEILSVTLRDMSTNPPSVPPPEHIKLISGTDYAVVYPQPGHAVMHSTTVEFIVEAGDASPIGKQYKLDVKVRSRDCNGRAIHGLDCVGITVIQCG